MPRKGRELEIIVSLLERHLDPGDVVIKSPDRIWGRLSNTEREVDVSLRKRIGSGEALFIIECRDRNEIQGEGWIDQVIGKREDVGAAGVMVVSTGGFTSPAINMAKEKGILLRTFEKVDLKVFEEWFSGKAIPLDHLHYEIKRIVLDIGLTEGIITPAPPGLLCEFPANFNAQSKVFYRKKDGQIVSLEEILRQYHESLRYLVSRGKTEAQKIILNLEKNNNVHQVKTTSGKKDVTRIFLVMNLFQKIRNLPGVGRRYSGEEGIFVERAEFFDSKLGFTVGINRIQQDDKIIVSLETSQEGEVKNKFKT